MNRRADWLAWSIHGAFGFLAGAVAGLFFITRGRAGLWLRDDLILPLFIGTALIGAGLGSRYGDRLWIGDNYRVLPPDEPDQSNLSDWLSWLLVAAGIATCIVTALKQADVL